MMTPVSERVQKRRKALRMAGLRPVQIWVPDTRRDGFAELCSQQARRIAASDRGDAELDALLDDALTGVKDWQT